MTSRSPSRCAKCGSMWQHGAEATAGRPLHAFRIPPIAPTSATWSICSKTWRSATATRNIEPRLVRSMTVGTPRPEEMLSDRVRQVLIGLGYSEIMSLPLTTEEHQFERLRLPTPERYPQVANPKLKAYNVVRDASHGRAVRSAPRKPPPADAAAAVRNRQRRRRSTTRPKRARPSIAAWRSSRSAARAATPRPAAWSMRCSASWVGRPSTRRSTTRHSSPAAPPRSPSTANPIGILGEVHPEVLTNFGLTLPGRAGRIDAATRFLRTVSRRGAEDAEELNATLRPRALREIQVDDNCVACRRSAIMSAWTESHSHDFRLSSPTASLAAATSRRSATSATANCTGARGRSGRRRGPA